MKRALVSGDAKGEISNVRTNSVGWVASAGDRILEAVEDRICDLFGCEPEVSICALSSTHPVLLGGVVVQRLMVRTFREGTVHREFPVHPLRR